MQRPPKSNPSLLTLTASVASVGLLASPAALAAGGCAKAQVTGGDSCANLVVKFDLSACKDAAATEPKVTCGPTTGKAILKGNRATYTVALRKADGSWGEATWKIDGNVSRLTRKTASRYSDEVLETVARHAEKSAPAAVAVADRAPAAAAQPPTAAVPRAPEQPAPQAGPLTVTGLVDAYYAYNFNRPGTPAYQFAQATDGVGGNSNLKTNFLPNTQNKFRAFDAYSNQIQLALAEIGFKYVTPEVTMKADLDFGSTADLAFATPAGTDEVGKHIGQAVISYTPAAAPNLTFNIGKMPAHLGYEVVKSKDNWQYSRSFLFNLGEPFWHTGASASYAWVPGKFSSTVYVYNGWNSTFDNNGAKTLGLQLAFVPTDTLALTYNGIGGAEQTGNSSDLKMVHELIAVWSPTKTLAFAGDFIYGSSKNETVGGEVIDPTWVAGSVHAKVSLTPWFSVSPRFEVYRDNGGLTTGLTQTLDSETLTNTFTLAPGLETRIEFRRDHSSEQVFTGSDGAASNSQVTATAGFLYSF